MQSSLDQLYSAMEALVRQRNQDVQLVNSYLGHLVSKGKLGKTQAGFLGAGLIFVLLLKVATFGTSVFGWQVAWLSGPVWGGKHDCLDMLAHVNYSCRFLLGVSVFNGNLLCVCVRVSEERSINASSETFRRTRVKAWFGWIPGTCGWQSMWPLAWWWWMSLTHVTSSYFAKTRVTAI